MGTITENAVKVSLSTTNCYLCGVTFGMPADYMKSRVNDHKTFYCPNGHGQSFIGKSEAEKLRDELNWERNRREGAERQRDAKERRLRATRGVVTKLKKKIAVGTCPCCSARFPDLEAHMREAHPDFDPEDHPHVVPDKDDDDGRQADGNP